MCIFSSHKYIRQHLDIIMKKKRDNFVFEILIFLRKLIPIKYNQEVLIAFTWYFALKIVVTCFFGAAWHFFIKN